MGRKPQWIFLLTAIAVAIGACDPASNSAPSTVPVLPANDVAHSAADTQPPPAPFDDEVEPVALPGLLDTTDELIPNDTTVRTGRLDNGLQYYVRGNDNPGGSAEMRLVVNAGSVNEPGSTGVAHFVEHMLFNGTARYPENVLNDVLRSFGSSYGADVSASVSFDDSVYRLTVPNTTSALDAGLEVLSEWLTSATFDAAQVQNERGVILDEWRSRTQSVPGRQFDVASKMYLAGTPYEGRTPLGTDTAIQEVGVDELRNFYDAWYRPDNAAVIVVGDVNVDRIVARIEATFSGAQSRVPAPPATPNRSFNTVFGPDREPAFAVALDADHVTVDIEVGLPLARPERSGTATWRSDLLDAAAYSIILRRLDRELVAGSAPFDEIAPGSNSIVRWLDAPSLYATTDAERAQATLQDLLDAYERASRYGFSDGEVATAVAELTGEMQRAYGGRDTTQDATFADAFVDNFLDGAPYPSGQDRYREMSAILASIGSEEVTTRFRARWDNTVVHTIVYANESAASQLPTVETQSAMIAELPFRKLEVRTADANLPTELMPRPEPVAPTSVEPMLPVEDPYFNPVEYTYPNGIRVILTSNSIANGRLWFEAASAGGSSLVDDADVPDALVAPAVVARSGLGSFDAAQVATITAGSNLKLTTDIEPYVSTIAGSSSTADLEVLMQSINQTMAAPRFDPLALERVRQQLAPIAANPAIDPELAGAEVLAELAAPNQVRYAEILGPGELDTVDLDGIKRVWYDRFGNASGWVFVFAGDVDREAFTQLSNAYLGTLPSSGEPKAPLDLQAAPAEGVNSTIVRAATGNTASVTLRYSVAQSDVSAADIATADVLRAIIDARLIRVITERFGASYSPSSEIEFVMNPGPTVETTIRFTTNPTDVESVSQLVREQVDALATSGPTPREFDLAKAQIGESYNYVDNPTFVRALIDNALYPTRGLDDFLGSYDALGKVNADAVRSFAAAHLPAETYIEVAVLPQ